MTRSPRRDEISVLPEIGPQERLVEVVSGLTATPKMFPMKYLYMGETDQRHLFEEIASMPDYHVSAAEERLLRKHIGPLVSELKPTELLDIGCGCGLRVNIVLDAMMHGGRLARYVGLDIAGGELDRWLRELAARYPELDARGIVGDFERSETMVAIPHSKGRRLAVALGQTLGNFKPKERVALLRKLWAILDPGDPVVVGLDFTDDLESALPGYDDAEGRNAAFSLNALDEINRLLGSRLKHEDFRFQVHADHEQRAIISSLVARRSMTIVNPLSEKPIIFTEGEAIYTERSQRFDIESLRTDLNAAGYDLAAVFQDPASHYGLAVAIPRAASQDRIYEILVSRDPEVSAR
jgi:L-histidine Nalpha-methyltransferase